MNAMSQCNGCHRKWHESPLKSFAWFESEYGNGRIDILREKMNNKVKVSKLEEKEIATHYRLEYKKIEACRSMGVVGIINFDSYQ